MPKYKIRIFPNSSFEKGKLAIEPSRLGLARVGDDVAVGEREKNWIDDLSPSFQGYRLLIGQPVVKGRGVGKLTEVSWWLLKPQVVTLRLVYLGFGTREIWV
jgi:hypothetical protein